MNLDIINIMDNKYSYFTDQLKGHSLINIENGEFVKTFQLVKDKTMYMMSTYLFFAKPGFIMISGDLSPKRNGVQTMGYPLEWFASKLEPRYLASKFLEEVWQGDVMKEYFKEELKELTSTWDAMTESERAFHQEYVDLTESSRDIRFRDEDEPLPSNIFTYRSWKIGDQVIEKTNKIGALTALLSEEHDDLFENATVLYLNLPAYKTDKNRHRWLCGYDSDTISAGYDYRPEEVGWLYAIQHKFAEEYAKLNQ